MDTPKGHQNQTNTTPLSLNESPISVGAAAPQEDAEESEEEGGPQTTPLSLDFVSVNSPAGAASAAHVLVTLDANATVGATQVYTMSNPTLSGNLPGNSSKFKFPDAGSTVYIAVWTA